ncbi:hypothetical protein FGIG_07321 [Fasciola gigantica]|uniref:Uncharacterized protein n=1 Tax=Fasciola gigantica TaxID=46835 RepID=A0A504YFU8_FASGI|nr:hypothetical protein FGIG_07321 [Fasciola gigantica]
MHASLILSTLSLTPEYRRVGALLFSQLFHPLLSLPLTFVCVWKKMPCSQSTISIAHLLRLKRSVQNVTTIVPTLSRCRLDLLTNPVLLNTAV